MVKHDAVDHPEEKVLVDLENQAGLRIPMSMGRVREDNDKSNCLVMKRACLARPSMWS